MYERVKNVLATLYRFPASSCPGVGCCVSALGVFVVVVLRAKGFGTAGNRSRQLGRGIGATYVAGLGSAGDRPIDA